MAEIQVCEFQKLQRSRPSDICVMYPRPCGECSECLKPPKATFLPRLYVEPNPLLCDACHKEHPLNEECDDIPF